MKKIYTTIFLFLTLTSVLSNQRLFDSVNKSGKKIGLQIANALHLEFICFGTGRIIDVNPDIDVWFFISEEKLKIEEVKQIIVYITDNLWTNYNNDPIFLEFIKFQSNRHPKFVKPYITPDLIGFKIAFWDKNNNRPYYPYLAQIIYKEEKFYFYYADPKTQALQEPIIETLEEAKNRLVNK